ncbi:MAG: hypothetical protein P8K68_14550 [Algibacter sp.]|uniref:hypothetical protein n=1 Tax=Algibacter sp. TaxID=1872428 RepID=UPI002604A909|nr:hypothetical protein [Algibacter sp.]MDG1730919.1 hypothetical protein [Algibacter sp.]MDG2179986.1 hypothetical protein [Algibacter sp.]
MDYTTKDSCILCGKSTEYTLKTPIEERINYIETAGQLCQVCSFEVYGEKRKQV